MWLCIPHTTGAAPEHLPEWEQSGTVTASSARCRSALSQNLVMPVSMWSLGGGIYRQGRGQLDSELNDVTCILRNNATKRQKKMIIEDSTGSLQMETRLRKKKVVRTRGGARPNVYPPSRPGRCVPCPRRPACGSARRPASRALRIRDFIVVISGQGTD